MTMLNADMLTADRLWESSEDLLKVVDLLRRMAINEHQCSVVYNTLADEIETEASELATKLRDFATRIDRSVPSRH